MRKCDKCKNITDLFFCPQCGSVIEYPNFVQDNVSLKENLRLYIEDLVNTAQKKKIEITDYVNSSKLAETLYRHYYEHITLLHNMCEKEPVNNIFSSSISLFNEMIGFGNKCKTNECQIAVVGTVKAGKSMFINAILGEEIASSYPTPETASLTKFRYSEEKDFVKISFYTDNEWSQLWSDVIEASKTSCRDEDENDDFLSLYEMLGAEKYRLNMLNKEDLIIYPESISELKKIVATYTSAKYPEHFFAKEVEVGLSIFDIPKNVVFVDTPGLNDPVKYRSEISRRYINSASIVLLCISADKSAIDATELAQTATIFSALKYAKDRIYVFGTKVDMPDHWQNVWKNNTKPQFITDLSKKYLFGSREIAEKRIFPVTAWYYNLIQRAKFNEKLWNKDSDWRTSLTGLVNECLGVLEPDDLEPDQIYRTPRQRFYDHIEELENQTFVPSIVNMLKSGPINEAEHIIAADIKAMYNSIVSVIIKVAEENALQRLKEIEMSKDPETIKHIEELTKLIEQEIQQNPQKLNGINNILNSLDKVTDKIFDKVK